MGLGRHLWGESARTGVLVAAGALLLGLFLGTPDLQGQEARWGIICREMIRSGDYVHPYLFDDEYYDKPLLSYWLMIGASRLVGGMGEWALRLPGALAALLTVFATARLGERLAGRRAGRLAGWMLLGCSIFVYWARTATADILNVAAVTAGAAWYWERRDRPGLVSYGVFFLIMSLGAQMKGLVAPVLLGLILLPDLLREGRWKIPLTRISFYLALAGGVAVYLVPFLLSGSGSSGGGYQSSGLFLAIKESVGRYFQPFDHKDPPWVYAIYLPLYFLPWTIFLLGALAWALRRGKGLPRELVRTWRALPWTSRWPVLASLLILAFLTLSGSRRNYYILPILPFMILSAAQWVAAAPESSLREKLASGLLVASGAGLLILYGIAFPIIARKGGIRLLAGEVHREAEARAPWTEWEVVVVSASPQMGFYLDPARRPHRINLDPPSLEEILRAHPRSVVVTQMKFSKTLAALLPPSVRVTERSRLPGHLGEPLPDSGAEREGHVVFLVSP
jgi:4-amino-4-deoxy-L-arabinose transferase-like glycosyltransferase